jgi:hypothetical protein
MAIRRLKNQGSSHVERGVFGKNLACRAWLVLILLLLPVILIFLKIPAETLAGCSTYGYGCSQVACMGIEVSTDQGATWRDGTVYIYGTPGSEKDLYVRTVLGVLSGQIQGWSFGVRHDASMLNGGQFSLNAAAAGLISTVQCGSPPDLQDTRRRPCGYTQGVVIDTGSTGCKVSAPQTS